MRWFKHLTDASDDDFLQELEEQFGWEGYGRWWKLCEVVGKSLKKTDARAARTLPWSQWQTKLRGKREKLRTFLKHLQKLERINMEETGEILEIELPKLLKYRDEYSKKSVQTPDTRPDNVAAQRTENREQKKEPSRPNRGSDVPFADDSREMKAARYLFGKIRANNAEAKEPNWQGWAREFDRLFRIDKREPADVAKVIDWAQSDPFWLKNVLSPSKLREQYDRLRLQMKPVTKKPDGPPAAPHHPRFTA